LSEKDTSRPIKVTDRRRFTADGELRSVGDEPSAGARQADEPAAGQPAVAGPRGEEEVSSHREHSSPSSVAPDRKPEFLDLVSVLAEPIPIFLGDVELPGRESAENLDLARFHIDLLDVLRVKTRSNLSSDEQALLDDLLYKLRMRYVQKRG
jgi:hypothetical protein